ncbi:MAG: hypothetical protein RL148_3245 [Planctomycetota bacterium]
MTPTPDRIRALAGELGFEIVRFGPAHPGEHGQRFLEWVEAGRHGSMDFLAQNRDRIVDPQAWRKGVQSAVAMAHDYGGPPVELPGGGRVARYAGGRDYHRWIGNKVLRLRQLLEREGMPHGSSIGGTDAVPVLERAIAVRAGIGFLAKSAMVISPERGPYLLLSELLTGMELPHDGPAAGSCGTCTACIDACPTQAITAPHQVDARRCLSHATIEHRGFSEPWLRAAQGEWVFGCDVCLEVCPFTRKSPMLALHHELRPPDLRPHRLVQQWTLVDVLALDETRYEAEWTGTPMRRATCSGLRRNAAVVLGNRRDPEALPALATALTDADPVVRGHAAWAIGRIDARRPELDRAASNETDPRVMHELERARSGAAAAD